MPEPCSACCCCCRLCRWTFDGVYDLSRNALTQTLTPRQCLCKICLRILPRAKKKFPSKCRHIVRQLHDFWICTVSTHTLKICNTKKAFGFVVRNKRASPTLSLCVRKCVPFSHSCSLIVSSRPVPFRSVLFVSFRLLSFTDCLNHGVNSSQINGQTPNAYTHTHIHITSKIRVDCYWFWLGRFFALIHFASLCTHKKWKTLIYISMKKRSCLPKFGAFGLTQTEPNTILLRIELMCRQARAL